MNKPARRPARASVEQLERRRLLAIVINEFLAQNGNGLLDQDGDTSDWIELRNTGASAVDVGGWHLSDSAANLTQWQFPSPTTIPAGGYLTVFASNKNRAISGQQLHTNFALEANGEDLLLVMADGTTVADSFLTYPAQKQDVSYGNAASSASTSSQGLVGASSTVKVISPTAENAAVDDHWREIGFNDSTWVSGTRSIGFDRDGDGVNFTPYIGVALNTTQMPSTRTTAYVRYAFNLADKDQLTALQLDLRFDDGFIAYLNGQEVKRANFGEFWQKPQPQWNSSAGYMVAEGSSLLITNRGAEALTPVNFDLTPYLPELVNGTNVLAFHAVNSASTTTGNGKDDLLIEPVLTATRATATAAANYMVAPTPGGNNGVGTLGFVADTNFSVDRGFFDAPFQVTITTATPGADIWYTTDGSVPAPGNGTLYSTPVNVGTTTTLRARAFKTDHTPTNVDTQTYIFLADVIGQNLSDITQPSATWGRDKDGDGQTGYHLDDHADWEMDPDIVNDPRWVNTIIDDLKAVPTMSVVMDWDDLFSGTPQSGTPAGVGTVAPSPQGMYIHGRGDERAMSLEYFNPDVPADQFQIDGAIETQGHTSQQRWKSDKLSFQVKFKQPYGSTKLDYPLFADALYNANAATSFDQLILDATHNYGWTHSNFQQFAVARFVTDQVISDLQNLSGGNAAHGKYVHLYLNGLYWGLYNVHERTDDSFADAYFGGDKDDYDVIKHASDDSSGREYTFMEGGVAAEERFEDLIDTTAAVESSPSNLSTYQALEAILDVDDFIDYMLVHYYGGNVQDWSNNNWYATRNRVEAGAKWHFHAWDQEHAFPTDDNQSLGQTTGEDADATAFDQAQTPTALHRNLMANEEYRLRFSDRVQALMRNDGGLLTPTVAAAVYQARVDEINRAIVGESSRWGDNRLPFSSASPPYNRTAPYNRDDFLGVADALIDAFFPVRTNILLDQFTTGGTFTANDWLVTLGAPVFSDDGGDVPPGTVFTISLPGGAPGGAVIYYTTDGSDPRLPGGAVSPSALPYSGSITLNESTQFRSRIFFNNTGTKNDWSPVRDANFTVGGPFPVRITEIHYHPANNPAVADDDDMEFIELLNTGSQTVNLGGVEITQFNSTPYVFGSISLAAGERIIVARDPAVFTSVYGGAINLAPAGYDPGNLSNGGERVILLGPAGESLADFTYDDIAPWPTTPDGGGPSLEIIDPLGNAADPANWRASTLNGGSPGIAGSDTTAPTIVGIVFDETSGNVRVEFSEPIIALDASDLVVEPLLPAGPDLTPSGAAFDGLTFIATFSFASPLTSAHYRVRLPAGSVTDTAGNPLGSETEHQFIHVAAGGSLALPAGTRTVHQLAIASTGQLDLASSTLIIDYASSTPLGSWNGAAYSGVTGLIQLGRIVGDSGVGVADSAGNTYVRATYPGDSDVDGDIDGDDYFAIDAGFSSAETGYANGDFDYNGRIDADDYFLIDSNYNKAATLAPSPAVSPSLHVFVGSAQSKANLFAAPPEDLSHKRMLEELM